MDTGEDTVGMVVGGLFCVLWLVVMVGSLAGMIFWIFQIIDVARREFSDPNAKVVWLLVVILGSFIGALIYHFVGKPQGRLPGS